MKLATIQMSMKTFLNLEEQSKEIQDTDDIENSNGLENFELSEYSPNFLILTVEI